MYLRLQLLRASKSLVRSISSRFVKHPGTVCNNNAQRNMAVTRSSNLLAAPVLEPPKTPTTSKVTKVTKVTSVTKVAKTAKGAKAETKTGTKGTKGTKTGTKGTKTGTAGTKEGDTEEVKAGTKGTKTRAKAGAKAGAKAKAEVTPEPEEVKTELTAEVKTELKAEVESVSQPVSPRKRKNSAPLIEELLSQNLVVPADLKLPAEYIELHEPEFIKGCELVISQDPSLYPVIVHAPFVSFKQGSGVCARISELDDAKLINNYWYSLIRSIIGQQISGYAAKSVENKFRLLFGDSEVTPQALLAIPPEVIRSAGLSNQKLGYVIHISQAFTDAESNLTNRAFYEKSTSDEIVTELVKLKGIGVWSAKMFALFTLKELDIFAEDDLGVARGVSRYFERRPEKWQEISKKVNEVEELKKLLKRKAKFETKGTSKRDWAVYHDEYVKCLGLQFRPYQSVFMLIMWRLSSTNVDVLENYGAV